MNTRIFLYSIILSFLINNSIPVSAQEIDVSSRYNYYTDETEGELLLRFPSHILGQDFSLDMLLLNARLILDYPIRAQAKVTVPFSLIRIPPGEHQTSIVIRQNGVIVDTLFCPIILRDFQHNAVKIDRASGGLIVDDLPFYPVGFYCYWPVQPRLPEEEVVRGFNMISPYQSNDRRSRPARRAYMDRCAALGMKVHFHLISVAGGGGVDANGQTYTLLEKRRMLLEEVRAFKNHPALLAWYIADEPIARGLPPDSLIDVVKMIRQEDPYHPISMVFNHTRNAAQYQDVLDIVMADPYPIPERPVTEIGSVIRRLKNTFDPGTPIWIVPQAFGGSEWWKREPTAKEIRSMTMQAVIEGATGVQFFVRHGPNRFPKSVDTWDEAGALARELLEYTPFLLSPANHPRVRDGSRNILIAAKRHRDRVLVLAVNSSPDPTNVRFQLPELSDQQVEHLFEQRTSMIRRGSFSDMMGGFESGAYLMRPTGENTEGESSNPIVNPGFEEIYSPGVPSGCYARRPGDPGTTFFVDSRVSREGHHSLRLITPKDNQGVTLSFYPINIERGGTYCFSVWAKAKASKQGTPINNISRLFQKLFPSKKQDQKMPSFAMGVAGLGWDRFELTNEWKRYTLAVADNGRQNRVRPWLRLVDQGTAWFDDMAMTKDPKIVTTMDSTNRRMAVSIQTEIEDLEIRYTLDGSEPTASSSLYVQPFIINKTTEIRVALFRDGDCLCVTMKEVVFHRALGRPVKYNRDYFPRYTGGGATALIDGLKASIQFLDSRWQGFQKNDMDVVIDLGEVQPISDISVQFLQDLPRWIFLPLWVDVSFSLDGRRYESLARLPSPISAREKGPVIYPFSVKMSDRRARYLRIHAKNRGVCPSWHRGAGGDALLFADEVIVQ